VSSEYFIGVNAAEIERLRAQHEAWKPETEALWNDADFRSCGSILDLGAGPGFTSLDLGRDVVPSGQVCAVDKAAAYLAFLAEESRTRSVKNVTVWNADVAKSGPIRGNFDGAFCRWFLAFLQTDLDVVLQNIRESLRPGGVFAAMEYLTLRSVTCSPSSPAFDAHTRAWIEFYASNGGNSSVGESLPRRLTSAGFKIRSLKCVGGMAHPKHRWWEWWARLIRDFGPKFVETGLLRSSDWDDLQRDWAEFSERPDSFIYTPILLQIVAERTR
jgi:SAM-dependent methyltransferase